MLTGEMSSHAKHLGELPQGPYLSLLGRRRCSDVDDGPQSGCDKQNMRDSYLPIGSPIATTAKIESSILKWTVQTLVRVRRLTSSLCGPVNIK